MSKFEQATAIYVTFRGSANSAPLKTFRPDKCHFAVLERKLSIDCGTGSTSERSSYGYCICAGTFVLASCPFFQFSEPVIGRPIIFFGILRWLLSVEPGWRYTIWKTSCRLEPLSNVSVAAVSCTGLARGEL